MKIENFFTKKQLKLKPNAKLYLCGPTTYDDIHVGNLRTILVFDLINRLLGENKHFKYVNNLTDLDDKIIIKAQKEKTTEHKISEKYIEAYLNILKEMNILKPTIMPQVTTNISGMIIFIEKLIDKGFAYEKDGSVYFSIVKFPNYAKFANINLENLKQKNEFNHDFVLWKKSQHGLKYESPWSEGRPGWHTECSFFVDKYFNHKTIDLHGGGIDLRFPHHVNEAAQFESLNRKKLAKNWIYIGHVNFNDQKMSKSLGNTVYVKDFIKKYDQNLLRFILLSTNYLKPLDFSQDLVDTSINKIAKINNMFVGLLRKNQSFKLNPKINKELILLLNNNLDFTSFWTMVEENIKKINSSSDNIINGNELNKLIGTFKLIGFNIKIDTKKMNDFQTYYKNKDYVKTDEMRKELRII